MSNELTSYSRVSPYNNLEQRNATMKMQLLLALSLSIALIFIVFRMVNGTTSAKADPQPAVIHQADVAARALHESDKIPNTTTITFTPVATLYLPLINRTYPWPVYLWLTQQQDPNTGLVASQEDQAATTYDNALAAMAFTLKGDYAKAKRVLDHFKGSAAEFFAGRCSSFDAACSTNDSCDGMHPCGFFQARNSKTGTVDSTSNRWIGDMSWFLMAAHYYEGTTGDTSYAGMITATIRLLQHFQQSQGYIASGWMNGDQVYTTTGHPEGNLNAYKALLLLDENQVAQQIKGWLDNHDFFLDYNQRIWKAGPLDLHTWRVLALGKEYGYVLPDVVRTDDATLHYSRTITYRNTFVSGFMPDPNYCHQENNIWAEGTGQMAVALYKADYQAWGNFYVSELEKLLFEPASFLGTQALSYYPLPSPCDTWADPTKGHVAAVAWYIFAKEHFDPYDGVVMNSFPIANPMVKLEAENYSSSSGNDLRPDGKGQLSEGRAIHIGGDDNISSNNSAAVEYKFNVLVDLSPITVSLRYADEVAGDGGRLLLDGSPVANFSTIKTGTWYDYIITDFPLNSVQLQPGLHTLRLEVTDNGTYGLTVDYFQMATSASVSRHAGAK
jgi:hypothetical protein